MHVIGRILQMVIPLIVMVMILIAQVMDILYTQWQLSKIVIEPTEEADKA